MAGPYPPNHGTGRFGHPAHGHQGIPYPNDPHQGPPAGRGVFPPSAYPGPLPPPPAFYPPRSRRRLGVGAVLVVTVAATVAALVGYAVRGGGGAADGAKAITAAPAKAAIQHYLNALLDRDIDVIARNAMCGIYDGVTDRRPDNAIAKMSSDAFRKQFERADVTSIDKIVYLSDLQAQALFSMRVTLTKGRQLREDTQGVAQLLSVDGKVLVCSYALRTAAAN